MIRIGISGWRYAPWRGVWYPPTLVQRREFEFCGWHFPTVEINGSFYSLQRPEHYAAWRDATPLGFVFAVKGSRYVTHLLRLRSVERPLANFFASGVLALGEKLGPILWQLPPTLQYDRERLAAFFALLPRSTAEALRLARRRDARMTGRARLSIDADRPVRHAVEVRHGSFESDEFRALAARHGIAVVVADTAGRWPMLLVPTGNFVYVRLHGDVRIYTSGYSASALRRWARRIRLWARKSRDVYVYFDNDVKVRAPFDALGLMRALGLGWPPREARAEAALLRHGPGKPLPHLRAVYGARVTGGRAWDGLRRPRRRSRIPRPRTRSGRVRGPGRARHVAAPAPSTRMGHGRARASREVVARPEQENAQPQGVQGLTGRRRRCRTGSFSCADDAQSSRPACPAPCVSAPAGGRWCACAWRQPRPS